MDQKISQSNKRALRNPWVIGWLAIVVIVVAVNVVMITLAVVTNPGLVSEDYYERGRYNERHYIQRVAERNALGWTASLDTPLSAQVGATQTYRVTVVDKVGMPLRNATVELNAFRPADAKADFAVPMTEVAPGQYQAAVEFPLKGVWDLIVNIKQDDKDFDLPRRLHVQGS